LYAPPGRLHATASVHSYDPSYVVLWVS
jgi:hypothetical protein